ncbi:epidermal retinol dehydrogenase 2 [Python bivittatus]|uniref:Epidermal retinol dehydrogenase 2 n=1 Tax=Python bivittatus TaxID=176946 RepID=A0A9F3W050_PYTBI|nr:epidermal retinol dehydrogenase 2 [Python bivittatus]XP_015743910.1 epidermal retinol dehydrogenase 2 [Python bivittatus]XP_015743911.1 epidermal retinol dehydrogenase 2 [Python bivittatus]XP_015743912.1 epidermal retinol dehydrogenase 2 [Python bivittatus]XP_025023689.1 epidermal retinol dehydrogenase 2 [Python bivittatus]
MNFFLETLRVILMCIYYLLEFFLSFIFARKKNIAGEIVLITGAGSGIGRLMALKFARLGAVLVLWDVNLEGNKETARLACKIGAARVHEYICDCSKRQEVYQVADQVKKEVGDVSILINNAGIITGQMFLDTPDMLLEKSIQVNTMAHFWTVKAFLPAMVASNHGHVVTISSAAGFNGVNKMADYCTSKFAVLGFAESLASEMLAMKKNGIKSTIVCPYLVNTGMFDGCETKWPCLLPIINPEYAAERIVSGILRNERYILMPRVLYFCNVMKSILPAKMVDVLYDYFGVLQVMNRFKGRTKMTED